MTAKQADSTSGTRNSGSEKAGADKKASGKPSMAGVGKKFRDKVEEEVTTEAISAFRAWRQRVRNGVLPIGIGNVGKTTFLNKFTSDSPDLFLGFNRTVRTKVDNYRLRSDFRDRCQGVEFHKNIDTPGEFPEEWARAYFSGMPRVLVVLVDNRPHAQHVEKLGQFLAALKIGPTFWQKTKAVVTWNRNNLSGILFVINKIDQFAPGGAEVAADQYRDALADMHSLLGVPIHIHTMSLTTDRESELKVFNAVVDLFGKK